MSRRSPSFSTIFLRRFRTRAIGSPFRGLTLIAIRPSMRRLHAGGAMERWCRAAWRRPPLGPLGTWEHFHSLESFPFVRRRRCEAERSASRCLDNLPQFLRGRPVQAGQVAAYHRVDVGDGLVPRSSMGPAARQCRTPRPVPPGPVGASSSYSYGDLHDILSILLHKILSVILVIRSNVRERSRSAKQNICVHKFLVLQGLGATLYFRPVSLLHYYYVHDILRCYG